MKSGLVVAVFMLVTPVVFGQTDSSKPAAPPNPSRGEVVPHWFRTGNNSKGLYAITADATALHAGKASISIRCDACSAAKSANGATEMDVQFGTVGQEIRADEFRGKRVAFSAYLKTAEVQGDGAALFMRVDGPEDSAMPFDNMSNPDRTVHGTTGWTKYQVVLDVPANADGIAVGALLTGKGQLWVADPSVEEVQATVPTTVDEKNSDDEVKKELAKMTPEQLAEVKKSMERQREWIKTLSTKLQNPGMEH